MFRFANLIFEPLWNRNYIDHIQITASESLGIQTRAGYYDRAGQIRDMFQNHMLQLLSLVTMEPPAEYNADHIRNQKMRLLETLNFDTSSFVTGQYGPGPGQCAYTQEPGVSKNSKTPTFAAARLFIENWRWKGVPVYMRSGKAMKKKSTAISIVFKKTPLSIFRPGTAFEHPRNILIFRIQPDEGFDLFINGKIPGPKLCMSTLKMEFNYNDSVETRVLGDAYERLLLDAVLGDQTLFIRTDDLLMSWNKIEPLLQKAGSLDPVEYPAGSWGPKEADHIMESDHKGNERFWINI
jgi:glucose-6-phosphate 1-dehydrogenase